MSDYMEPRKYGTVAAYLTNTDGVVILHADEWVIFARDLLDTLPVSDGHVTIGDVNPVTYQLDTNGAGTVVGHLVGQLPLVPVEDEAGNDQ